MPWRSRAVRAECSTATSSPKRARKRATSCGVSAISGTRTMDPRPAARAAAMTRRYTSVLPLPVTPCRRNVPARGWARAPAMASMASRCAGVASWGTSRSVGSPKTDSRGASRSSRVTSPASHRRLAAAPALFQRSSSFATGTAPVARTCARIAAACPAQRPGLLHARRRRRHPAIPCSHAPRADATDLDEERRLHDLARGVAIDGGQGQADHLADGREVVRGEVPEECEQILRKRGRVVRRVRDGLDVLRRLTLAHGQHHAHQAPRPEGAHHARPRPCTRGASVSGEGR